MNRRESIWFQGSVAASRVDAPEIAVIVVLPTNLTKWLAARRNHRESGYAQRLIAWRADDRRLVAGAVAVAEELSGRAGNIPASHRLGPRGTGERPSREHNSHPPYETVHRYPIRSCKSDPSSVSQPQQGMEAKAKCRGCVPT